MWSRSRVDCTLRKLHRHKFLDVSAHIYRKPLDVYPDLRCGHSATLPTARLTRHGADFLHEGVGCLPVAQVTVACDANMFHHNLHLRRHTVV